MLAQLYLNSLTGKISIKTVRTELKKLEEKPTGPAAYDEAYESAMERIENQVVEQKDLAKKILCWITCARGRLRKTELEHALAVKAGNSQLDDDDVPQMMVEVCAGLVTMDEETSIIRLVHHTTQDYFNKTRQKWFPEAESDITTTCVTYLSFDTFKSGFCHTEAEFEHRLRSNPLYEYCALNWGHHARKASTSNQLNVESSKVGADAKASVTSFLERTPNVEASSQAMLVIKATSHYFNRSQTVPRNMTGLHLAAYFGLVHAAEALLNTGRVAADSTDGNGQTPLSWAIESKEAAVAKLLLQSGAKVDYHYEIVSESEGCRVEEQRTCS